MSMRQRLYDFKVVNDNKRKRLCRICYIQDIEPGERHIALGDWPAGSRGAREIYFHYTCFLDSAAKIREEW